MLLKTNGTLWLLGTNRVDHRLGWPGLRAFQPQPLGTHSNWAEISSDGWSTSLRSQDGKAWSFVRDSTSRTDEMIVDGPLTLYRVDPWIEQTDTVSATWVYPKNGPMFRAGVLKDGTFQLLAVPGFFTGGRSTHWNMNLASRRLDAGTNWLAVAGNQDGVMTLRADGTLWRWRFEGTPLVTTSSTHSKQVSNHSDWVAIADCHGGVVSLAADGGLWFWRFQPSRYAGLDSAWPRLLAASRRPQFLGNLLDDPAP